MAKTIAELTAEIREVNVAKGWRSAEGGPGENTWGDYIALLHSEVSEALEAYRDHRLADATKPYDNMDSDTDKVFPRKPEGVGSELADVLIRLLDMCDVFGIKPFDMDMELGDVAAIDPPRRVHSFGDYLAWLHGCVSEMWVTATWLTRNGYPAKTLRALVTVARTHDIDLDAEVERKIAFNRTRTFQHGGRTLAGEVGSA